MADFKTHVAVGAATGYFLSVTSFMTDLTTNMYMSVIIFFSTVIGSFLPDMDSNSGLPVQIIFGLYAYFAATITLFFMWEAQAGIYLLLTTPIAAFALVHYVVHPLFDKYTSHRGIFHSFPAVIIVFLLTLLVADNLRLPILEKFAIALAIGTGYFSHLLLDEIYSVNFLTTPRSRKKKISFKESITRRFSTKRSFGTALDLGFNTKDKYPGVIAYIILVILFFMTYPILESVYFRL